MGSLKVFGSFIIRLAPQEERGDLPYCRKEVARRKHTDIEIPIIEIGLGGYIYNTAIETSIGNENLPGFTSPEQGCIASVIDGPDLNRERLQLGQLFRRGNLKSPAASLILNSFGDIGHDRGVATQSSHQQKTRLASGSHFCLLLAYFLAFRRCQLLIAPGLRTIGKRQ